MELFWVLLFHSYLIGTWGSDSYYIYEWEYPLTAVPMTLDSRLVLYASNRLSLISLLFYCPYQPAKNNNSDKHTVHTYNQPTLQATAAFAPIANCQERCS